MRTTSIQYTVACISGLIACCFQMQLRRRHQPVCVRCVCRCGCRQLLEVHGERAVVEYCNMDSDKVDLTNCGLDSLPPEVRAR